MDNLCIGQCLKGHIRYLLIKWLIIVKIALLFITFFSFCATAKINAQTIDLNAKKMPLVDIFSEIRKQTNYRFIYPDGLIDPEWIISVNVKQASLADVLQLVTKEFALAFNIHEGTIVIKKENADERVANTARQQVINGVVRDQKGAPLAGASVQLVGKSESTVTDRTGAFRIRAQMGDSLRISFLGFNAVTVKIDGLSIEMSMQPSEAEDLDEVVVIGYGQINKSDLTGAVGVASVADMQKAPVRSFEEALAGRVAGVQVTSSDGQPGEALSIIIRGSSSITSSNSPLYVIDDFPIENPDNNVINPNEIESITVLKDASSTAIYGARGANGVVIIKTKSGRTGDPKITYNGYYGVSARPKKVEVLNPYEFVKLQQEIDPNAAERLFFSDERPNVESYRNLIGIDWQDQLYRKAPYQNHDIAISGGSQSTKYAVSGSLFDQKGIISGSGFNRMQGRVKLDQDVNKRLKVGINTNYAFTEQSGTVAKSPVSLGPTVGADYLLYNTWGYRAITGSDSTTNSLLTNLLDPDMDPTLSLINPIFSAHNELRSVKNSSTTLNGYANYTFSDHLSLRVMVGANLYRSKRENFNNSRTRGGSNALNGVNGSINNNQTNNLTNENVLTYNRKFDANNHLNVVGIYSTQVIKSQLDGYTAIHLPNETLGISGLDQGAAVTLVSTKSQSALQSFAIRANYTLLKHYMLTATFRADGSSKFPPGSRWGYFPSAAFAWRLSEEDFFRPLKPAINSAKLRASYGLTGNNRVGDFDYLSQLTSPQNNGYYTFGNRLVQGFRVTTLGNGLLKWESTRTLDAGLELGIWNDKVQLEVDYYQRRTYDLLLNANMATSTGYTSSRQNIGSTQNSGIEASVSAAWLAKRDFTWTSHLTIAFNRNKVLSLADGENSRTNITNSTPFYSNIIRVGRPIYQFFGYVFDGVYQFEDFDRLPDGNYVLKADLPKTAGNLGAQARQPGDPKYRDLNKDGIVNDLDRTIIGSAYPKHYGGLNNNLSYKNFDLNLFFQWSYGNSVYNANRYEFEGFNPKFNLNAFASYANRWTPENPSNRHIRVNANGRVVSDYFIEDASFLRLKTMSLGYNMSNVRTGSATLFKSARIYLSAQNVVTWTNYSGLDPEVSVNATIPGLDFSAYPRSLVVTAGVNVTF